MSGLSRRQLLTTASGAGAATMLGGAMIASASPHKKARDLAARGGSRMANTTVTDGPINVDLLQRVTQKLVPPPFLPAHDQVASGAPKVVQVRLVIEEKTMVIDDEGTEIHAMTFNGSVPGPIIVVHSRSAMIASASPHKKARDLAARGGSRMANTTVTDGPINVDLLQRVTQKLVPPPFLPAHDQVASGAPKVVQVRLVIEEKTMVIDDEGTEIHAMTFNGSVPGPIIVVHQGDYVELTLVNPESNSLDHNIDFHGATGAMGGGELTHVNPGEKVVLRFRAIKAGVFVFGKIH